MDIGLSFQYKLSGRRMRVTALDIIGGTMPFFYQSGEQVQAGDRVLLHREPGEIEFIADPVDDADERYVRTYAGGVMILEPKFFGRLFLKTPSDYDDLEFVSRKP